MSDATRIIEQIDQGDPAAAAQLLPIVYDELRRLAAARLDREKNQHSLDATALVHEAYLRLVDVRNPQQFNGRSHFFGAASEAMRRILVEAARRRQSLKKGGQHRRVDADPDLISDGKSEAEVLEIDEALGRLADENPQVAKLVELKYFANFTIDEAASILEVSPRTAHRHWAYAKAWLRVEIGASPE